jgi:threonine dehydrogenase-like Zn-dependent dehydrogenase
MKKAIITGVCKAELIECPTPKATGDLALVKIHAAPMCTEYKIFLNGHPEKYLGHEAAGEVIEAPENGCVKAGDRVVVMPQYPCGECRFCRAGDYIHCEDNKDPAALSGQTEGWATYAQYMLKPSWLLPKIPDGISYELASLACCGLGPTFGAMESLGVTAFDTVLVAGLGPVGLGGIVNAKYRGARVVALGRDPWRRNYAEEMGADLVLDSKDQDVVNQIREFGGRGVDCALDCTGVPEVQRMCIESIRRKGGMAFIGEATGDVTINAGSDMIRNGINLIGAWHYNLNLFPKIMQVVQFSPIVSKLITHVLPMSNIQSVFELSASREHGKIILHPWE